MDIISIQDARNELQALEVLRETMSSNEYCVRRNVMAWGLLTMVETCPHGLLESLKELIADFRHPRQLCAISGTRKYFEDSFDLEEMSTRWQQDAETDPVSTSGGGA